MSEADVQNLMDMFGEEDLLPELESHIRDHPTLGKILHHPLVIQVPFFPGMNRLSNRQFAAKKESLDQAVADQNWDRYVFLHERPYRIDALQEVLWSKGVNSPDAAWPLIASVWIDSENISEYFEEWLELWDQDIPNRHLSMDDDERAAFAALPDVIDVYRGIGHDVAVQGMSWTTDRDKAIWFARRYGNHGGRQPTLATGRIEKSKAVAYFLGRGESEIVAFPDDVMDIETENLK